MAANSPDDPGSRGPSTDKFWPQFWYNVCRYSEQYYLLLNLLTVFAVLNAIAMLIGPQSTGAFVISVLVFVILGITGLSVGIVLYQCNKLQTPDVDDE